MTARVYLKDQHHHHIIVYLWLLMLFIYASLLLCPCPYALHHVFVHYPYVQFFECNHLFICLFIHHHCDSISHCFIYLVMICSLFNYLRVRLNMFIYGPCLFVFSDLFFSCIAPSHYVFRFLRSLVPNHDISDPDFHATFL